jgi:hypothetical protein
MKTKIYLFSEDVRPDSPSGKIIFSLFSKRHWLIITVLGVGGLFNAVAQIVYEGDAVLFKLSGFGFIPGFFAVYFLCFVTAFIYRIFNRVDR